jgi:cyclohexanecarboxylate-CoA ligase
VAWQLPNCAEAVVAMRACWRLGAIAVPLHHGFTGAEVARLLDATEPSVVLDDVTVRNESQTHSPLERSGAPTVSGEALGAVLFTSGSSGTPKGVLHTQHTLAYKARTMAQVHGLGPDDVVLMPAPLAHVSGMLNGVTLPGVVPFRTVVMRRWDAGDALELVEREGVTFMIGPPTFFVAMLQSSRFSADRVASLRLVSSGGAGVTEAFVEMASERLGCVVKRTYGSTETPTVATSRPDDPADAARLHDGRAIASVELRVADSGELEVRGAEMFCGYLDAAANDTAFTDDGFYRTGDLATLTADGWLNIVGRIADVIIRGGENIAAAEVEAALEAHPSISQAVAVGVPDDVMGERVLAFVVAENAEHLDVEWCRSWFAQREVARFKTPEHVVVVDALPLLATGKPDRTALRAEAARLVGPR